VTDADLWAAWRLWMAVATVVVVIAASLLIVIWLTARRIYQDAVRALNAAQAIRAQTQPIWGLQQTNEVAEDILQAVQAIEQKSTLLAEALAAKGVRR
jgi:negative regulator of sigma E activity